MMQGPMMGAPFSFSQRMSCCWQCGEPVSGPDGGQAQCGRCAQMVELKPRASFATPQNTHLGPQHPAMRAQDGKPLVPPPNIMFLWENGGEIPAHRQAEALVAWQGARRLRGCNGRRRGRGNLHAHPRAGEQGRGATRPPTRSRHDRGRARERAAPTAALDPARNDGTHGCACRRRPIGKRVALLLRSDPRSRIRERAAREHRRGGHRAWRLHGGAERRRQCLRPDRHPGRPRSSGRDLSNQCARAHGANRGSDPTATRLVRQGSGHAQRRGEHPSAVSELGPHATDHARGAGRARTGRPGDGGHGQDRHGLRAHRRFAVALRDHERRRAVRVPRRRKLRSRHRSSVLAHLRARVRALGIADAARGPSRATGVRRRMCGPKRGSSGRRPRGRRSTTFRRCVSSWKCCSNRRCAPPFACSSTPASNTS